MSELNLDLRLILMVSQLDLKNREDATDAVPSFDDVPVLVEKARGGLSPRDRRYHEDLGADEAFPELSKAEAELVRKYYPAALAEGFEA